MKRSSGVRMRRRLRWEVDAARSGSSISGRKALSASLEDVRADAIRLAIEETAREGKKAIRHLRLSGRWQADQRNRLVFTVARSEGVEESLTFQSAWSLTPDQEIIYTYRKRTLAHGTASVHAFRLSGAWEPAGARNRIAYRLDAPGNRALIFRGSIQNGDLRAKDGRMLYQVGIQLEGGRTAFRSVAVFGAWKINNDYSVTFECERSGRRPEAVMNYKAGLLWMRRNELALALRDERGKPLGVSLRFSRKFSADAEAFLQWRKEGQESSLMGGVRVRF